MPWAAPRGCGRPDTPAKRALYDNLGRKESLTLDLHSAVCDSRQDDWRSNMFKVKKVRYAIKEALGSDDDDEIDEGLELVKAQYEY